MSCYKKKTTYFISKLYVNMHLIKPCKPLEVLHLCRRQHTERFKMQRKGLSFFLFNVTVFIAKS